MANADTVAEIATCQTPTKYYKSCECGAIGTEMFESGELGDHNVADEWSKDDYKHYNKCKTPGCNYVKNAEDHTLTFVKNEKESTCYEKGTAIYKCDVCDEEVTKDLELKEHVWSTIFAADGTYHWLLCVGEEDCDEISAKAEHKFDQEVATIEFLKDPATCMTKEIYYKSCVCGFKGTETFEHGEVSTTHIVDKDVLVIGADNMYSINNFSTAGADTFKDANFYKEKFEVAYQEIVENRKRAVMEYYPWSVIQWIQYEVYIKYNSEQGVYEVEIKFADCLSDDNVEN